MLVVSIIWVIVGIVYVLYKTTKEGDYQPLCASIAFVLAIGFVFFLCSLELTKFSIFIIILLIIASIIIVPLALAYFGVGKDQESSRTERTQELQQKFEQCGYPNIDISIIDNLAHNALSPLNHSSVSKVSYSTCYNWMCEQETWEIDKLSQEDLGKQLGVSLDEIPLDQSKPLGEAALKRTLMAKQYILKRKGLCYRSISETYNRRLYAGYLNDTVYEAEFKRAVADCNKE